jgi:hypothetical protein
LQEDSTSVTCAGRERAHQLRVSSKRGAPSIEGEFILAEEKRFWEFRVFLAGVLASFLVVSGGISAEGLFVLRLGRFPKRRAHHYLEGS